jgi:lipopolysaccharide/colanic/teichoic acid biosynthesis glycosyltransferase
MSDLTVLPINRHTPPGWSVVEGRAGAVKRQDVGPLPEIPRGAGAYLQIRAAAERVIALALLAASAPLLLVLGLVVRLTSKGPVLYSQRRVGRFGKMFAIYKLRTMTDGCERHTGPVWAVADDPRTTGAGRWLRDFHLDEIPQLWNVLCGDMSLIGPRPERPEIAARIEQTLPEFRYRLLVRPGITGLAQLRLPADADLDTVRRKLELDLYYIRNLSPVLDARVALSTPLRFLGDVALSMSRRIARPAKAPLPEAHRDIELSAPTAAPEIAVELRVAA